ncbi:preprotein translocase subunit YajC [Streptomyces sp. N2-109]|uniref:Preprotein translocase subunit YajC n=1 Tax=Streptomyces gossypii TaxID=2883101 RepID=A0ABT2JL30_9ACTN|nr:preprotein translocase subunit YajC [Streptomyces gossypii]MCT2588578.1 preprotein translocase subunit YajC [Streptomyces gossypii]
MNIVTLLPFVVLIGAMFLMTRSAKKKQQKASQMRNEMQPGTGVRTIGGMYAVVKEVREDAVLLEVSPGWHALYAKNAVGAVLEPEEFDRIMNGEPIDMELDDAPVVPDDASELTEADEENRAGKINLGKPEAPDDAVDAADAADTDLAEADADEAAAAGEADEEETREADATKSETPEDAKTKGDSGSK